MTALSPLLFILALAPSPAYAANPCNADPSQCASGTIDNPTATFRAGLIKRGDYEDYVAHICGRPDEKVEGACADKFKNLQVLLDRWYAVCKEPTDPGSPFYQEQMDEARHKCPVRKSFFAPIDPDTWKRMPVVQRQQEIQDIDDFRLGFDRTAGLYHELMTADGWKAKDLVKQLNKDTVGIVPSFGSKDKAHLTVREAIFVYLGPDGLNKLIGAKDLKGKPQAAQLGNNGATSRYGQLQSKDHKLDAQMKQSGKKAKEMAKSLEKVSPLDGKLDDDQAAAYVADLGSASRFLTTGKEAQAIAVEQNKVTAQADKKTAETAKVDKPAAGILDLSKVDTSQLTFGRPCSYFDSACKIKKAGCVDGDYACRLKATLSLDGVNPAAVPEKEKSTEKLTSSSGLAMTYDPQSTSDWQTMVGDKSIEVTEYRNSGGLERITFAQSGPSNGYESYVAVDGKHALQPVANDPAHWQVQPGSQLEVKSAGGAPGIWRLSSKTKTGVLIPKDQVLSDDDLRKLGLVKVETSIAPKRLVPVAVGSITEYKQADNGDIMGVAWTPAGGKDGGSYAQVRGGKDVKLEPTATSYLVKGPATLILKSPNADVKTISVPAGKVVEIDRNTKTAKDAIDASQLQKPSPAHAFLPAID